MDDKRKNIEWMADKELFAHAFGVREDRIADTSLMDLMLAPQSICGIGQRKADRIYAIREIARRLIAESKDRGMRSAVDSPDLAAYEFRKHLKYEDKEHFCILCLSMKNRVIAFRTISVGSLSASIVHPREVFREALKFPTAAIIVGHNHPSGDVMPSKEDRGVTDRLVKAGKILDIPVLDHIIIGSDGHDRYLSFKEAGYWPSMD